MPEYYPGEHLQTVQVLVTSSGTESMIECLKIVIYQISNNAMAPLWNAQQWEATLDLFSRADLYAALGHTGVRERSLTARAFLDNLFRAVINAVTGGILSMRNKTRERALGLIKGLLSSGQDPNICINLDPERYPNHCPTPLERAVGAAQPDLTELLLIAGADPERACKWSRHRSLMDFALAGKNTTGNKGRMIKLLLPHTRLTNLKEVLHAAFRLRDPDLVEQVVEHGQCLLASTVGAEYTFYHDTALRVAAAVDIDATTSILRHIEVHYPSRPTSAFITPGVFIAAASAGNTDVILFLHGINPIGGSPNLTLYTPLQAAVSRGHLGTCQLLLRLYGGLSATLIFIACRNGHWVLLQYLLQNGLSVNEPMTSKDTRACGVLCNRWVADNVSSEQPITVLQYLLNFHPWNHQTGWPPDWIELLIGPDTVLPPGSLVRFAELWWDKALLAALDAGGSANETSPNGQSALHCALRNHCGRKSAKQLATVKILLERGAQLHGWEVLEAIRIRDRDLVKIFLERGAQLHGWEVLEAIRIRDRDLVKILLERGAQLHGWEVLEAMRIQDRDLVLLLLHHGATLLHTRKNIGPTLDAAIMLNDDKLLEAVVAELSGHYDAGSLCLAIESGNIQIINLLLANRPQKAEADLLEGTAVGLAANWGDIQLVQKLLEHLGKPDSALLPCISGDELWQLDLRSNFWRDKPEELIESNPLTLAVSGGIEGFSELLENGYQPDRLTWLRVASLGHHSCLYLERLLHFKQRLDGIPRHPLETAPLLCECIQRGNKDVLHYLLKAGADANEHNCTHIDVSNRSPLQKAVEVGNLDIIDLLIQAGAHINAPPSFFGGATALQIAAIQGNLGLAKQLLDLGARINARGARKCGRTALEGAAEHGRLDMLQLLLHSGALTTGAGQHQFVRAIHFAERRGHDAAADLLRRSRDWIDEDADLYEKRSPRCGSSSECDIEFYHGQRWWRCLDDENGQDHCCGEIHNSGGECIHDYTDIEDLWYVDRAREMDA
jgi:ankyrin repeat protein